MWTDGKVFKRSELRFPEVILELAVKNVDGFEGKIPAAHARLVSYNEELKALLLKKFQGLHRIREILHVLNPREVVLIEDECSIPV